MENNLPEGWVEVELEEVAADREYPIGDGDHGQIKPSMYTNEGIPYIRVSDIGWGTLDLKNVVYISEKVHKANPKSELKPDDVLIAKTGATIGKCCIVPESVSTANTTSSVGKISLNKGIIHPKWLLRFFLTREFKDFMWSISERTAQPGFNNRDIKKFKIPLPPITEQHRIVGKLETLMERMESSKQRLDKIPVLLKRFRQSVLAVAVSGRLTDTEIDRIPLGKLIVDLKYGTSQKSEKDIKGIPILRIPNIADEGKLSIEDLKFAHLSANEYEKLKLFPGDILLIPSNGSVSLVGKTAIVTEREKGFAYAGYLIRIRCNKKLLIPEFLNLVLASYDLRLQIELPARSTSGVNNINSEEVKALEIPLPSIEEQQEIVRRVEQLFAFAEKIEARYTKVKAMLDKLPQSILAKAFRGELVPQDPNDEPASVLLERIKAEKTKMVEKKQEKTRNRTN